ncbi:MULTISPECIES: DUF2267 domain-containing protein [unclassified Streptomyces]|uniref:DUF2267 domain-containing protein n=1 Tax=unclassified Streptomyces TaxID=2593676 RepID=UPI0038271152
MFPQPNATSPAPATTFGQLVERVRYEGVYATSEKAEQAVWDVLAALGRQLTGEERAALATALPVEAALELTAQITTAPRTGAEFVSDLATRTGGTTATARWDAGTVFTVIAQLAGDDLVTRILHQLPPGYALLFGRADLTPAA